MKHEEDDIQSAFFDYIRLAQHKHPDLALMFHPANGGKRDARVAARMKRQGVVPGVPDVIFPCANHKFFGLAIEFKSRTGKLSENQAKYIDRLLLNGWSVHVCRDARAAVEIVKKYIGNDL